MPASPSSSPPYVTEWRGQPARFKVSPDLAHLLVPIGSIRELPDNPRRGEVAAIKRSLVKFAQRKPLVVNVDLDTAARPHAERTGVAEAGNHTTLAALADGWTHLAVSWEADDEATALAYAVADNRTSEIGSFDLSLLAAMTGKIEAADPALLLAASFDPDAMEDLLAAAGGQHTPEELFTGGYAESDESLAERMARAEAATERRGGVGAAALLEIVLRYAPQDFIVVAGRLRRLARARGDSNAAATVMALVLDASDRQAREDAAGWAAADDAAAEAEEAAAAAVAAEPPEDEDDPGAGEDEGEGEGESVSTGVGTPVDNGADGALGI